MLSWYSIHYIEPIQVLPLLPKVLQFIYTFSRDIYSVNL